MQDKESLHHVAEYNKVVANASTIIQKKINCKRKSNVSLINSHYGAMKEFNRRSGAEKLAHHLIFL